MNLKGSIKKRFDRNYFDVAAGNGNLVFKLHNPSSSKSFLIVKHHDTGKRISKEMENSEAVINISEILSLDELGVFDIYLKTNKSGKASLKRMPFKSMNENVMIYDENHEFVMKSVSRNSSLSFELRNNYGEDSIDITKVYGEDISDLVYRKPDSQDDFQYKLSAIVLVYNGGDLLRQCLNSLVNQTLEGLEIILINDNSTDDSLEVCKEFASLHDNIRIIDKQENHGLATSANMGIQIAKGEYVTLVDNDDIVVPDGYEKLYRKAKELNADISVGQANLLFGSYQTEMHDVERKVLEDERTLENICEFPLLLNDAFYWNKIFKKSLLVENDIYLPKGMIYADRKFSHMAYVHADTISTIPDCVYMWRMRTAKNDQSLSSRKRETWNYINRIESYELDLDKIISVYPDYFKILMRRVIIPVRGVLESDSFKRVFFDNGVALLKRECGKLDDVYDNCFDNWDNIIIALLLNNRTPELYRFLNLHIQNERSIVNRNGKSYWNIFLFDKGVVPDEALQIKSMMPPFLNIGNVTVNDEYVLFDDITLPKHLKTSKCEINFVAKTNYDGVLLDNIISHELTVKDPDENVFCLKVPASELGDFGVYDLFFKAFYEDRLSDNFRVKTECLKNIQQESKDIFVGITPTNHISIISQHLDGMFDIEADDELIRFNVANPDSIRQKVIIHVQNDATGERTMFSKTGDSEHMLEWKHFADLDSSYSIYITVYDNHVNEKRVKVNLKNMANFNDIDLDDKAIYADDEGNLKVEIKP